MNQNVPNPVVIGPGGQTITLGAAEREAVADADGVATFHVPAVNSGSLDDLPPEPLPHLSEQEEFQRMDARIKDLISTASPYDIAYDAIRLQDEADSNAMMLVHCVQAALGLGPDELIPDGQPPQLMIAAERSKLLTHMAASSQALIASLEEARAGRRLTMIERRMKDLLDGMEITGEEGVSPFEVAMEVIRRLTENAAATKALLSRYEAVMRPLADGLVQHGFIKAG